MTLGIFGTRQIVLTRKGSRKSKVKNQKELLRSKEKNQKGG